MCVTSLPNNCLAVHRYTRKGVRGTISWLDRISPWVGVEGWSGAQEDLVECGDAPYDPETYDEYMEWYASRTRLRCVRVVADPPRHEAATSDTYPTQPDSAFHRCVRIQRSLIHI